MPQCNFTPLKRLVEDLECVRISRRRTEKQDGILLIYLLLSLTRKRTCGLVCQAEIAALECLVVMAYKSPAMTRWDVTVFQQPEALRKYVLTSQTYS